MLTVCRFIFQIIIEHWRQQAENVIKKNDLLVPLIDLILLYDIHVIFCECASVLSFSNSFISVVS